MGGGGGGGRLVVVVALLFAALGSAVVPDTVAVLETLVPELKWTTSAMVAEPLLAIVPSEQETVVVPLHDPCDGVADTNEVLPGMVSLTVAPAAALGPALLTVMV